MCDYPSWRCGPSLGACSSPPELSASGATPKAGAGGGESTTEPCRYAELIPAADQQHSDPHCRRRSSFLTEAPVKGGGRQSDLDLLLHLPLYTTNLYTQRSSILSLHPYAHRDHYPPIHHRIPCGGSFPPPAGTISWILLSSASSFEIDLIHGAGKAPGTTRAMRNGRRAAENPAPPPDPDPQPIPAKGSQNSPKTTIPKHPSHKWPRPSFLPSMRQQFSTPGNSLNS
jgi:hypothetical protein